ncbi:hypothetical protein HYV86_03025 [Candidatus Woesearchaeota archaeon]|nr:hypothetical protein [Candidatus Woesearchaeota archaeon]
MIPHRMQLLLFLFSLVLVSSSLGHVIENVSILDTLHDDLSLHETVVITIAQSTQEEFLFIPPNGAYNLFINQKPSSFPSLVNITLDCASCQVVIEYDLGGAIEQNNLNYALSRTLNIPFNPQFVSYDIIIPAGMILDLTQDVNDPSIVPAATQIITNGKNIIVSWREKSPQFPQRYYLQYRDHEEELPFSLQLKDEFGEWELWFLVIIGFGIGILGGILFTRYYLLRNLKTGLDKSLVHSDVIIPRSLLGPDEQIFVDLLQGNSNQLDQRDIGKKLDWSKSKVSAIATNLDFKKVIEREKRGRNYVVRLVKKVE